MGHPKNLKTLMTQEFYVFRNKECDMVLRPSEKKNIFLSGTFIAALLTLTMISIFLLSSENNIFTNRINLVIEVPNAQNLKNGAAVQLKGIQVGTVSSIDFTGVDNLKITFNVDAQYQEWIRKDSYVAFKTQGVLGDKFIEILGGTEESPVIEENSILPVNTASSLDKFIDRGEDILVVAARVLAKVDLILGDVEQNAISGLLTNLNEASFSTKKVMSDLEKRDIAKVIDQLSSSTRKLDNTLGSIENVSKRIEQGPGSLHSLIYDRSVHDDLSSVLGGTKRNKVLQYFIRESIKSSE